MESTNPASPSTTELLQEYAIVQQELDRCSHMFWAQAEFFLTFCTAILGFTGYMLGTAEYMVAGGSSVFGLAITVLWLLFGNRIGAYVRLTERRIREVENEHPQLLFRIKTQQREWLNSRRILRRLERIPSSEIVRTALPVIVSVLWIALFSLAIALHLSR